MLKQIKNISNSIDILSILLFILVSISYPRIYKIVIPIFIILSIFQFYRTLKNKTSLALLIKVYISLLVYSLIFFRSIHTIVLGFCIVFCLYYFFEKKTKKTKINYKTESFIIVFLGLVFLNLVIFKPYLKSLDTYLYLLFYPILFFFIKKTQINLSVLKLIKIFVLSVFVASFELLVINLIDTKLALKTNTFFAEYLDLSHVYFGLFLGVSCSFLLMIFDIERKSIYKKAYIFLFIFFCILLVYTGARMSLLAVLLIFGLFLFQRNKLIWYKKGIILILVSIGFSLFCYKTIPRLKNDLNYIKKVYISVKTDNKDDLVLNSWRNMYQRFLVTKYTVNEIKENVYLGIGLQNVRTTLGNKVHKDGYKYFEFINPHNQYLHIFLGMGVFCFCFFLIMLGYFFKQQITTPYFIIFFLIIMITESILVRVKGISVFFLFSILLSLNNKLIND